MEESAKIKFFWDELNLQKLYQQLKGVAMIVPREESRTTRKAAGQGKIFRIAVRFQNLWGKILGGTRRYQMMLSR